MDKNMFFSHGSSKHVFSAQTLIEKQKNTCCKILFLVHHGSSYVALKNFGFWNFCCICNNWWFYQNAPLNVYPYFFLVSKHHKSCKGPSWLVVVGRLIMKILRTLFNLYYSTYTEQKFTPCPNKLLSPSSHLDPNFALVHLQSAVPYL